MFTFPSVSIMYLNNQFMHVEDRNESYENLIQYDLIRFY